jgi:hypothetical protein
VKKVDFFRDFFSIEHVREHAHLCKYAHARASSIKHKLCPRLEKTINYARWILLAFATLSTPASDPVFGVQTSFIYPSDISSSVTGERLQIGEIPLSHKAVGI